MRPKSGVFSNWDKQAKQRKLRLTLPTEGENETRRHQKFKKLAVQNSIRKAAQNEPAPNPDNLVFINHKDGKIIAPAKTNTEGPQTIMKKPFHMIQEQLSKSPNTSTSVDDTKSNESEGLDEGDVAEEITSGNLSPSIPSTQPRRSSVPLETYMRKHDSSQLSSVAPIAVMGSDRVEHPTLQEQGQHGVVKRPDGSTTKHRVQTPPKGPRKMLSDTTTELSQPKQVE
ncbi:MAG: hypothetical protein Q9214_008121, partial [Letrouitia sp. 1 TL-2023]